MTDVTGCDEQLIELRKEISLLRASSGNRGMKRHAQTLLVLVLVALLVWVGATVQKTAVTVAELKIEMSHIHRNSDGDKQKFNNIEKRLDAIELQLTALRKER